MDKLVSIITPAYNCEEFIEETIDSVLNQTYQNWEMIIIDDCSTDKTSVLVNKYSLEDSRIKLVSLNKNGGVSNARNIGLSKAQGSFVAFLDSDDIWAKNKLENQISFMEKNDYYITYSSYAKFITTTQDVKSVISVPHKMEKNDILKNTIIGCLTVIINVEEVGSIEMPNISHAEDQCTWINVLERGYVAYGINEVLAYYRINSTSLSGNKIEAAKKQWTVYRKYHHFSILKSLYYYFYYAINVLKR
ncbi:glycosyltransferase family 2 protein [Candidatus Stoquefichus sp. SB1]|uniref:glycosyltransferase family 2 protein n=1 Tax=Candidatus Stoquefichus sp. SB1 TaxID=1658109 RepID=UPI00067EF990|nr:glycosyltransferase family 2 protein [Candidatus Stoquefichus sp. SB1]